MREAGFEPAHPEIVGLKSTALDHSAIRAQTHIFIFWFYWGSNTPPNSYTTNLFKLVFGPYIVADVAVVGVVAVAVVAVAGAIIIMVIIIVIIIVGVAVNIAYESVIVRII